MLLDRCQTIETGMKRHIVRVDKTRKLEELEGKTFGQLLQMFRPRCSDQELNDWLESLRQLRNDVAHSFFRETELLTKELGEGYDRLNDKVLRKGLRMTEILLRRPDKTRKVRDPKIPGGEYLR